MNILSKNTLINLTRLYSVKLQSINQAEYLRMDIGRKQIVLHVEKCIFTAKNLHS